MNSEASSGYTIQFEESMDNYIQGNPKQLITIQLHISNSVISRS